MAQNLTYTQCGDYFIPDIRLAHTEAQILGKYGRMRRMFLEQNKPILFNDMILNETLFLHLWEVQQTCVKRMELLMEELLANNALLTGFLLVSATACGKQPAADAAQPVADPTQAYLDTVDVDYAYELALKLEDIRSSETLGYRTTGSDAELATGDMLKAEMERIGLQNVTKDAFTLDTQDSLFGLSRRCIPSWVSRAHPSFPLRRIYLFIDSLPSYRVEKVFLARRAA